MDAKTFAEKLLGNVTSVIRGKDDVVEKCVICVLSGGHILLEDVPGTGKTTLIKALAKSMDLPFSRIQFTPDLLPSDVTGANIFDQKTGEFVFRPGPVFTGILLADEINRATPRTQSGLLECMEERRVSVDGETRELQEPFLVAATQNPVEIQGTFPLPEAQLDRFFMRLSMGYPDAASEREMLSGRMKTDPLAELKAVAGREDVLSAQASVREIHMEDAVKDYILQIVAATRRHDRIRLGVSPRGSIALMRASQAKAAVSGRDYVIPEDVKAVAADVLCHRISCKGATHNQMETAKAIIDNILASVQAPAIR